MSESEVPEGSVMQSVEVAMITREQYDLWFGAYQTLENLKKIANVKDLQCSTEVLHRYEDILRILRS